VKCERAPLLAAHHFPAVAHQGFDGVGRERDACLSGTRLSKERNFISLFLAAHFGAPNRKALAIRYECHNLLY